MNFPLFELRTNMIATLLVIIGFTTLLLFGIFALVGVTNIVLVVSIVALINIVEWLFGPKLIDRMYHTRELKEGELPEVKNAVKRIAQRAGIKEPKLVVANIDMPNAFAYGSPLTGNKVAVTSGLLRILNPEEVEAVLGHELGHLKHRDVQVMMIVSILPAILYYIAYIFMINSLFDQRNNSGVMVIIGIIAFLGYMVLSLLMLAFSRMRESYADFHSTQVVDNGARKLSSALAKLYIYGSIISKRKPKEVKQAGTMRALFIVDPSSINVDDLKALSADEALQYVMNRKTTFTDRIEGMLSTHPNIVKRINNLKKISESQAF
ncbi:MAG: zinc metalloprotease HtpX [Conexivisphaerales archaeon]